MNTTLKTVLLTALVSGSAIDSALADSVVKSQRAVGYADLDLERSADAAEMLLRLERAASGVCGGDPRGQQYYDIAPGAITERYEQCRESALSRAVLELDNPIVSRLYQTHGEQRVRSLADRD